MTLVANGFGPLVSTDGFTLADGDTYTLQALNNDPSSNEWQIILPGSSTPFVPDLTAWNPNAVQTFSGGVLPISSGTGTQSLYIDLSSAPDQVDTLTVAPGSVGLSTLGARRPRPGSRRRPPRGAAAASESSHSRRLPSPPNRSSSPTRRPRAWLQAAMSRSRPTPRATSPRRSPTAAAAPWTSARCRPTFSRTPIPRPTSAVPSAWTRRPPRASARPTSR